MARASSARRAHRRTPQVEHEDSVARPVHARDRAAGERMAGDQALLSLCSSGARRPAQARRPVDRPRAEPRHGVAQAVIHDRRGGGARGGFRRLGGDWRGRGASSLSGGSGPCRKAILSTHRQPRCAFTRATITEALCCASSAKALSTLSTRVAARDRRVRIAFGGPRRPLQLDRPGVTRERSRRQWPANRRSGLSRPSRARPAPRRSTRG